MRADARNRHDADGLVAHHAARFVVFHRLVGPQVAAADAGAGDADGRVLGSSMVGSGTFSMRTSPAPYMHELAISDALTPKERAELLVFLTRIAGRLGLPTDVHSALRDSNSQTDS